MNFRYQLENRLGKKKVTCPECGQPETFTRYMDTITGELLGDQYGMCDRAVKCNYSYSPPKNYLTDEESEIVYQKPCIYETGFLRENWFPKNDGLNNSLTKNLVELFGKEDVYPVMVKYQISNFYDGGTIYPYTLSGNLISGKVIFYNDHLKRLKGSNIPDAMWLHNYHYTDKNGRKHTSREQDKWFNRIYPLFGWDLIGENPEKFICVVEGEKTAIICSIIFPEFVWVAAGALKWLQSYKFPEYNSRVWLFFADLEPKQPEKNYYDYWNNRIKKIRKESGFKLKYSSIVDYTTERTEQSFFDEKGDIADILLDYKRWDIMAEKNGDRMYGKIDNYRKIVLSKIYSVVEKM